MFRFFKEHSYEIVRLFFTQIGISVLGLVLSFSTNSNKFLFLISSLFASIFYVCLLYSEAWELGAKDRPRITNGRMKFDPIKGIKYSLFSNTINFIFVAIMLVCIPLGRTIQAFGDTYFVTYQIQRLISAMYMGINTYFSPANVIDGISYVQSDHIFQPLFYLAAVIPSVLSVGFGYYMGANDRKLFTVSKPE